MIKRSLKTMISLVIILILLSGCSGSSLSEGFDEEQVKEQAKEVIIILNDNDSEALLGMCTVEVKEALTEEVLESVYEALAEGGEFESLEDISVAGKKDKNSEEEFAIVVANAKYELKKVTFTITFTQQMKIAGLFYK